VADQRRQGQVHEPLGALIDEAPALLEGFVVLPPHNERRAQGVGPAANNRQRFVGLAGDDGRYAGLQDAGLFAGDGNKRGAELVLMVERDGRDDRERRPRDHVGGIEAAAEAHLQDRCIGRSLGEGQQGRGRRDLEEGDGVAGIGTLRARQHVGKLGLADGVSLAVGAGQLDALAEAHQMRRGVDVHALAGCLQHGLEIGRSRALAVGAGNVDDGRQARLRIAELGQQPLDAAERKVDQLGMQDPQLGQQLIACAHGPP
jgi:hypothetical protein